MSVDYTKVNWKNSPSTQTPLNATNLNKMDTAIDNVSKWINENESKVGDESGLIAAPFSTTKAYSKGDLVVHEKQLYAAKNNVAAGAWNASNFETVTVSAKLAELKAAIDAIEPGGGGEEETSAVKLDTTYRGQDVIASIGELVYQGYQLKANAAQMGKTLETVARSSTYNAIYYSYVIPIPDGAKHVEYSTFRSGTSYSFGSLFLDANRVVVGYRSIPVDYAFMARTKVPEGAKYFVYSTFKNQKWIVNFTSDAKAHGITSLGLHTRPLIDGVLNGIKNARQMTDVKWHAIMDLPRTVIATGSGTGLNHQDVFDANKEYVGIPYSDPLTDYTRRLLFTSTPLEAFITANLREGSVQDEESQYAERAGSYYGTCCTGLTAHAVGIPYMYSGNYLRSGDFMIVAPLNANTDFDELMLLDVFQHDGHCLIVTDILRDDNGHVEYIEICEQTRGSGTYDDETVTGGPTGGITRRCTLTIDQVVKLYSQSYQIIRFTNIDKIRYIPTEYSPVDEGDWFARPNFPLLPYYGNNCVLHQTTSGAPNCRLIIGPSGYNKIVVKKNGETFGTFDIPSGATYVDIPCQTDAAVYSAKLALYSGDTLVRATRACSWYVTDAAVVTTSKSGTTVTFTVTTKCDGFYPWFGNVDADVTTSGYNRMIYDNYTETTDSDGNHVFTFSVTRMHGSATPTVYVIGLRSDKYGAWYFSGNVA